MDMGRDLETVLAQRQKDDALLKSYGVTPMQALDAAAKPTTEPPPKKPKGDDDDS